MVVDVGAAMTSAMRGQRARDLVVLEEEELVAAFLRRIARRFGVGVADRVEVRLEDRDVRALTVRVARDPRRPRR